MVWPKAHILIIEDDPNIAEFLAEVLRRHNANYEVDSALDGPSGLAMLDAKEYAVVILDYILPGLNGLQVLEKIRTKHPQVPVLFVTGMGNEDVAVRALKGGAADYITKSPDYIDTLPFVVDQNIVKHAQERDRFQLLEKLTREYRRVEVLAEASYQLRPELDRELGKSPEEMLRLLDRLSEDQYVLREFRDTLILCPHCQSHRTKVQYRCPECNSYEIAKGIAIEHYECRHVDFMQSYKVGPEEALRCPECGKRLKQIGVDYRKIGSYYRCRHCLKFFGVPLDSHRCQKCGESFETKDAVWGTLWAYRINEERRIEPAPAAPSLAPIAQFLEGHGFQVAFQTTAAGKAGIVHHFDLVARRRRDLRAPPDVVADLVQATAQVPSQPVLAMYAKAVDVGPKQALVFAIPAAAPEARRAAERYRILLIEGRTPDELALRLRDQLR